MGPGIDGHWIHIISLAAHFRTASRSSTLGEGLSTLCEARKSDHVTCHAFSAAWEESLLYHPMSFSTVEAQFRVDWTIRAFVLFSSSQNVEGSDNIAFRRVRNTIFQRRLAKRATMILRPISKHRITQVRPDWPLVLFASLKNGLCTSRRFLSAKDDHTCSLGCQ